MTEASHKKVVKEIARLEEEFSTLEKATNMSEACKQIVEFVDREEEPFAQGYGVPNPYAVDSGGPCQCAIM